MNARKEAKRTGQAARLRARRGEISGSNTGIATGVYCNLVVILEQYASDFQLLCRRNPVALPLLERLERGSHESKLAKDSDVSTDVPFYNIYHDGVLVEESASNISEQWGEGHVGFLLGCSFTLELALAAVDLKPRNMSEGKTPPVFITTFPLSPSGVFVGGFVVVSMRWYDPADVDKVRAVIRRLAAQHGEPIAWGWEGAELLGVKHKLEQQRVDCGEWSKPMQGEVPVFWGCGVTAEYALQTGKLPGLAFTHRPG